MEVGASKFVRYVFVCENERADGKPCCMPQGARIREALKDLVKSRGFADRVRVSRAGCLDLCAEGPSAVIMPDNVRLGRIAESDVEKIFQIVSKGI